MAACLELARFIPASERWKAYSEKLRGFGDGEEVERADLARTSHVANANQR